MFWVRFPDQLEELVTGVTQTAKETADVAHVRGSVSGPAGGSNGDRDRGRRARRKTVTGRDDTW